MKLRVTCPEFIGVQVQNNALADPAPKSIFLRSTSVESTENTTSKDSASTFPALNTLVSILTGSPTCGMLTSIENCSTITIGSGRKSLTPCPITAIE